MTPSARASWMQRAGKTRHRKRLLRLEVLEERSMLAGGVLSYTTLDVPDAVHTGPQGINGTGQVVGYYIDAGDIAHRFLLSGGSYTTLGVPGELNPSDGSSMGINDAGQVVGSYYEIEVGTRGFLLSGGGYTTLTVPGAYGTSARGINDAGQIVGNYVLPDEISEQIVHGFLLSGGNYKALDAPGALQTMPCAINNAGQIVGYYVVSGGYEHNFFLSGGNYSTLEFPDAVYTFPWGINDAGQIVGGYTTTDGRVHGFLLSSGNYSTLDVPGAVNTTAMAINNAGQIVGSYAGADNLLHGFLVTSAQPDIAAIQPTWNTTDGGVDFGYRISGANLPHPPTVALYWASGITPATTIGSPIATPIATKTAQGSSESFHAELKQLGTPPQSAKYLLAVVNPPGPNHIPESDETNGIDPNDTALLQLTDIVMLSAKLESPTSVTFDYAMMGDPGPFTVGLYRSADGQNFDPATPIATETVTPGASDVLGTGYFDNLSQPLTGDILDPYLLVVANPTQKFAEINYNNDIIESNIFCYPGVIHPNVLLPAVSYNVSDGKIPFQLAFAPLGVDFTNQSLPVGREVGQAQSNVGTLTASLSLGVGGSPIRFIGYSTGQATLRVAQDGTIDWFTPGFAVTAYGLPVPFVPPRFQLGNTGPLAMRVSLAELGLTESGTSFDVIIRMAENYVHSKLSDELFGPLLQLLSIADPGNTELLVTDQDGNQTGRLPNGTIVQQIPGSAYFPDYPLVVIADPQSGVFTTRVQGRSSGKYLLVTTLTDGSQLLGSQSSAGLIAQGQSVVYSTSLDLSPNGSTIIKISNPMPPLSSGFGVARDAFITTLYTNDLDRLPEPRGLRYWSRVLAKGSTRKTAAAAIWNSPEHRSLVRQHLAPRIPFLRSYADALFAGHHASRLRRSPSASAAPRR